MILKRILSQAPINWKYALGEIFLIFVGISLSLLFEEWRGNRAKDHAEQEHLALLSRSVEHDLADLDFKLRESTRTLSLLQYLISAMEHKRPFNDSIEHAMGFIVYNPQFNADLSGIKNIEGQELVISDFNLRTEIHRYYGRVESNVEWAGNVQSHIDRYFGDRVITDFKDFMYMEKGVPINFEKLSNDYIFINALKRSLRLNVVSVDRLQSQQEHARAFLATLKKKIG